MAVDLQQTQDPDLTILGVVSRYMAPGGVPGNTPVPSEDHFPSDPKFPTAVQLVDVDAENLEWAGGTLTARLNITTGNGSIDFTDIWVDRRDSTGGFQERLADFTYTATATAGVHSQAITISAPTATNPGDVLVIIWVAISTASHGSGIAFQWTPDQIVNSPLNQGAVLTLDQDSFRGRNDDGSEAAATWKAPANTNFSVDLDTNFRLRFLIQETAGGSGTEVFSALQFSRNGGAFESATSSGSTEVLISGTSPHVIDGEATTQQLGTGVFVPGSVVASEFNTPSIEFAGNDETEVEYVVQFSSANGALNGDTYEFRVVDLNSQPLDTITASPVVTAGTSGGQTFPQAVGGTLSFVGATTPLPIKLLAGSLAPAAAMVKQTARALAGALSPGGVLSKRQDISLGGTTGGSGTAETVHTPGGGETDRRPAGIVTRGSR